jgi:hypothetical protein
VFVAIISMVSSAKMSFHRERIGLFQNNSDSDKPFVQNSFTRIMRLVMAFNTESLYGLC